jgi:hypothetical protein
LIWCTDSCENEFSFFSLWFFIHWHPHVLHIWFWWHVLEVLYKS